MGVIKEIIDATGLKVEIGGGIRNMETIEKYIDMGASRIILARRPLPTKTWWWRRRVCMEIGLR